MNKAKDYDFLYKLVLIGDTGVGKSCILLRFSDDTFTDGPVNTVGVDFKFRTIKVDKKSVKLKIWDTAGQERFRTITSAYYRQADGIIMVYDVTSEESFNHVSDWLNEVDRYAPEGTNKLLVGNKCDRSEDKLIPTEKAQAFADALNIPFLESSAKDATNIQEAFETIAKALMQNKNRSVTSPKSDRARIIAQKNRRLGCC